MVLLAARVCLRAVEGLLLADDERGDAGHQEAKVVSYTHLDVYKRQADSFSFSASSSTSTNAG